MDKRFLDEEGLEFVKDYMLNVSERVDLLFRYAHSGILFAKNPDGMQLCAGEQIDLMDYLVPAPEGTHYDIASSNESIAHTHKHSGLLYAMNRGTTEITVYHVDGNAPSQNPNLPDGDVLGQESFEVEVLSAAGYGWQGDVLGIRMVNPVVLETTPADFGETYVTDIVNTVLPMSSGKLSFTFEMTHGFNNYNSPDMFAELNEGNLVLGMPNSPYALAELNVRNRGDLIIAAADNNTKTVTAQVDTSNLYSGTYKLEFLPTFRSNNSDNTLKKTIAFQFTLT